MAIRTDYGQEELPSDDVNDIVTLLLETSALTKATVTAGETLAGATLPVAVYQDTSTGKFLKADANDTSKMVFAGFVLTDGDDTDDVTLQTGGIVTGFSGLTPGAEYFLQDTAGTIGTTASSTQAILVGVALSASVLLIKRRERAVMLYTSRAFNAGDGAVDLAHGLGKKPTKLLVFASCVQQTGDNWIPLRSSGFWCPTAQGCNYHGTGSVGSNPFPVQASAGSAGGVVVHMTQKEGGSNPDSAQMTAVATVDATNVTLTWDMTQNGFAPTETISVTVIAFTD